MIDAAGLRVMKAIADEGSFTSAANALGFTQPAISQMVRRLEQRTGTVLVERYGRQVRLTEAGQVLARHAVGCSPPWTPPRRRSPPSPACAPGGCDCRPSRARRRRWCRRRSRSCAPSPRHHDDLHRGRAAAVPGGAAGRRLRRRRHLRQRGRRRRRARGGPVACSSPVTCSTTSCASPPRRTTRSPRPALRPSSDFASEDWIAGCPRCRAHLVGLADRAGFRPDRLLRDRGLRRTARPGHRGLGVALVPDIILNAAKHDDVATLSLSPVSQRQILAVTTPTCCACPPWPPPLDALCAAAGTTPPPDPRCLLARLTSPRTDPSRARRAACVPAGRPGIRWRHG